MKGCENVLVVAPHPDDEILGCGGIMAKFQKDDIDIFVAIMTSGNVGAPELFPLEGTLRGRDEALNAHDILGVKETFFYDFPAPRLETFPSYRISNEIEKLIRKLSIDTMFIPHRGDIHKDHRIIYEASLVAARPINNNPVKKVYAYETLSETEWAAPFGDDTFFPTFFVELSEQEIQRKLDSFSCFSPPRLKEYPHSRSLNGIKTLARYRGMAIERPYAECFMLTREIVS